MCRPERTALLHWKSQSKKAISDIRKDCMMCCSAFLFSLSSKMNLLLNLYLFLFQNQRAGLHLLGSSIYDVEIKERPPEKKEVCIFKFPVTLMSQKQLQIIENLL